MIKAFSPKNFSMNVPRLYRIDKELFVIIYRLHNCS